MVIKHKMIALLHLVFVFQNPTFSQVEAEVMRMEDLSTLFPSLVYASSGCSGNSIEDPQGDMASDFMDLIKASCYLEGPVLKVTIEVAELPNELIFNREGLAEGTTEYRWQAEIDVDGDPSTGSSTGSEYLVMAIHRVDNQTATTMPIDEGVQAMALKHISGNSWSIFSASLDINTATNIMTLRSEIPNISEDTSIVVNTLEQHPVNGYLGDVSNACMTPAMSARGFIVHVSSSIGGFEPNLIIANTNMTEPVTGVLEFFNKAGSLITDYEQVLEAGETLSAKPEDLANSQDVSHIGLRGSEDVRVSITYLAQVENASVVHVHESQVQSQRWRFYQGDWDATWDGIAVLNTSDSPVEIEITQYTSFTAIRTVDMVLGPLEKGLMVLSNSFNSNEGSYFELTGDQPFSVVSLRGTQDQRYLWENLAIPL